MGHAQLPFYYEQYTSSDASCRKEHLVVEQAASVAPLMKTLMGWEKVPDAEGVMSMGTVVKVFAIREEQDISKL